MAIERRDYFVKDEFNDVWNDEALPTFGQAHSYRGMIQPQLNYPRTLRIVSVPRAGKTALVAQQVEIKRANLHSDSEF